MFICLCHGVSDRKIHAMIDAGARSVQDVQKQCNAGLDCGKCLCELRRVVHNHLTQKEFDGDAPLNAGLERSRAIEKKAMG